MAARPNALRTLEYGKRLVENQIARLEEMINMTESVLAESKTLTGSDIAGYKACIATANKHLTQFRKINEIAIPDIAEPEPRKRGRPSQAELAAIASTRGKAGKGTAAALISAAITKAMAQPSIISQLVTPVDGPKKRGRKSKATLAAEAAAAAVLAAAPVPKKRGRPAKVKADAVQSTENVAVSGVDQGPAAKRRGRPPKQPTTDSEETLLTSPAINTVGISETEPVKRGPGRPKGSKNAPKLLNGQHTEIISVN